MKTFGTILLLILSCSTISLHAKWINTGNLSCGSVWSLAINGSNLFAATDSGVYRSTNSGNDWSLVKKTALVYSIVLSGSNLITCSPGTGVILSTDNGNSWTSITSGLFSVFTFQCMLAVGNNVYAGCALSGGVYLSTNNGIHWLQVGIPDQYIVSLSTIGNTVFAATSNNGIFCSSDSGYSWKQVNNGLTDNNINSLFANGNMLIASTQSNGLFNSTDNGSVWKPLITPFISGVLNFISIGNLILIGTNGDSVFSSDNRCTNWSSCSAGLNGNRFNCFAVDTNYVYSGSASNSVWRRSLSELTGVANEFINKQVYYSLLQNYPNPFNPVTKISYKVPFESKVKLTVFNSLGQTVRVIENSVKSAGDYDLNFYGNNINSGVYFYSINVSSLDGKHNYQDTRKMVLMK